MLLGTKNVLCDVMCVTALYDTDPLSLGMRGQNSNSGGVRRKERSKGSPWRQATSLLQVALQLPSGRQEQAEVRRRGLDGPGRELRVVLHPHKVGVLWGVREKRVLSDTTFRYVLINLSLYPSLS